MSVFALGVVGAAVELTELAGTMYQGAAAAGALAGGNGFVFLLTGAVDVAQMLAIGLFARLQLGCLDGIANGVNLRPGEAFVLELIDDFLELVPVDHARFLLLDLNVSLPGKRHDGHYRKWLKLFQDASQGTDMASILQDGIVELILVTVDVLCPVLGVLPAVNPTVVVLGFYDENAIDRHHQMVNLRTPFGRRNCHVVQHPVLVLRQMVQLPSNDLLPDLALRWDEPSEQEEEADDCDGREYGPDGFH